MDVATVLEEYLADITNLPADLAYILDEIKARDKKLQESFKKIAQRDGAIQKFVKQHGPLAENAKEPASYPRIRQDYQESLALQQEKHGLSLLGLYLITKQVKKLQSQVDKLEHDGLLAPAAQDSDEEASSGGRTMSVSSRASHSHSHRESSTRHQTPKAISRSPPPAHRKDLKRSAASRDKTGSAPAESRAANKIPSSGDADGRPQKRARVDDKDTSASAPGAIAVVRSIRHNQGDEVDDVVYCVCRQGSHGNMIACDSDTCEFEWFHWDCVGLTEQPTGTWYCPQCRAERGTP